MAPKAAPEAKAKAKADAKPKPKPKKEDKEEEVHIPKPDKEAMEAKLGKITEEIEKLQAKKKALDDKIKSRSSGNQEYFTQKNELANKINQFKEKINQLHAQKDELQKGVSDKKEEKTKMAGDLKKMKASIGFKSEEEIDGRIREIEYKIHTETMPLKQEKDLLKEIQELKRNRPKVSQVSKMEENLGSFEIGGADHKTTMSTISEQIRTWLQEKAKVVDELKALNEAHSEALGDLPKEREERDGMSKKIAEKIQERNKVRDEFREEENKFRDALRKKRAEQQERYVAERAQRAKEYEDRNRIRRAEKMDEQPYMDEITLLEQTIKFCKSLTGSKEKEEKAETKETDHGKLDGLVVLGKKDERDEFWFEPTKGKKKGKAKTGKEGGSSKPIKHNAETFKLFDQLKLDAPIMVDDIPPTLEKLESMLENYLEKVKAWEKTRDAKKAAILAGEDVEEEKSGKDDKKEEDKADDKEEEEEKAEEKAEDDEKEEEEKEADE